MKLTLADKANLVSKPKIKKENNKKKKKKLKRKDTMQGLSFNKKLHYK